VAKKLLAARFVAGRGYRFRVWLDTTKTAADGGPDPLWVRQWQFGETPPPGILAADYRTMLVNQVKALSNVELAEMQEGAHTSMPAEGQEF
jgi:hypothetical protein